MRLTHLRWIVAASLLSAMPLRAQLNSSGPDYFAPGAAVGGARLHIVANEFYNGKHQMIYTSAGTAGPLAKAEVIGARVSGPALVYDTDGLHVFVIDTTGRLQHRKRSAAGAWDAAWSVVGKGSQLHGRPAAVIYKGTTYIFAIGGDGVVWFTTGAAGNYGATWKPVAGFKTLQSPSAMADGKRLMLVGISPQSQIGYYTTFNGSAWSPIMGLYTDPANAPKGQLIVAAGDRDDSIWLASALFLPANTIMVADAFADKPKEYSGQQLDAVTMTAPVLTRHVNGNIGILVRSAGDKLLWYRQLVKGTWTGWSKVDPPR